jgi:hypothetical protein
MNETERTNFGYIFYPSEYPGDPGHPRLDIFLRTWPTQHHFDPELVALQAVSPFRNVEHLRISHPWTALSDYQTVAGLASLTDRLGKQVYAFTFGGRVHIEESTGFTWVTLTSPAPILGMIHENSLSTILARESELLLAERRAAWAEDRSAFDRRLITADPFTLYMTFLRALRRRFEHYPHQEDTLQRDFLHFLHTTSRQIYRTHPGFNLPYSLEDVL